MVQKTPRSLVPEPGHYRGPTLAFWGHIQGVKAGDLFNSPLTLNRCLLKAGNKENGVCREGRMEVRSRTSEGAGEKMGSSSFHLLDGDKPGEPVHHLQTSQLCSFLPPLQLFFSSGGGKKIWLLQLLWNTFRSLAFDYSGVMAERGLFLKPKLHLRQFMLLFGLFPRTTADCPAHSCNIEVRSWLQMGYICPLLSTQKFGRSINSDINAVFSTILRRRLNKLL